MSSESFILLFSVLLINLALSIFFDKNYYLINIYDAPNTKIKKHKTRMPVYGGMIFICNFLIFTFIDILYFNFFFSLNRFSIVLIVSVISIFFLGLIDDKNNLKPLVKSVFILLFSSIIILSNNDLIISEIKLDNLDKIFLYNFSFFFTVLCIFVFINSYNMLDGADLNIAFYNFFVLIFLFYKTSYNQLFLLFLVVNFFFFILNFKKKTFFGNNGSYFFSFFISVMLIYCFKNYESINEEDIILVTIFPVIEMIRLFFTRIVKDKSPFVGDNNHFHHMTANLFGKFNGILVCQLYIVSCSILDFLFNLNLWLLISLFLVLYFISIYIMNNKIFIKYKKK